LAGGPCQPHGPNVKIIADGKVRYPDVIVACAPAPVTATIVDNPLVVFEVLSEGTGNTDLIEKNREYRATPSIQRYVIVQQTHAAAIVFVRFVRKSEAWPSEIVAGDGAHLSMPEIGIDVPPAELYAGTELIASETAEPTAWSRLAGNRSTAYTTTTTPSFLPALGIIPGARMIDASVLPPSCRPRVKPRGQAQAGIHDLLSLQQRKSWIPACAGMTGGSGPCLNVLGRWH
jgi:hypothetical protein